MARRLVVIAVGATLSLAVLAGCGGRGEKGVNQDKDRPRTVDSRK